MKPTTASIQISEQWNRIFKWLCLVTFIMSIKMLFADSAPAHVWSRLCRGSDNDRTYDVKQASDAKFIACGVREDGLSGSGVRALYLLKQEKLAVEAEEVEFHKRDFSLFLEGSLPWRERITLAYELTTEKIQAIGSHTTGIYVLRMQEDSGQRRS